MDFRLSLLLVALSFGAVFAAEDTKPKISIYFESLCGDSQRFFMSNFSTGYEALKKNIELEFVPYGHANATGCQHGPLECEGNKILECGVSMINDQDELQKFVVCIMTNNTKDTDEHFNYGNCSTTTNDFDKIIKCSSSSQGEQLFKEFGNKTDIVFKNLTNFDVPFISVNGQVDPVQSMKLRENFLGNLCSTVFKDKNLGACSSSTTLVASVISTLFAVIVARL